MTAMYPGLSVGAASGVGEPCGVAKGCAGAIDGDAAGVTRYTGPGEVDGTGVGEGIGGGLTGEDVGNGVA
jgi:hypothetical protein